MNIMSALSDCPGIVQLVRFHSSPSTFEYHVIMSPVANGGDLKTRLQHQFLNPYGEYITEAFVHSAMWDLCDTLRSIHTQFVRHKDIKPGNLLIHHERLLYADFGSSIDFSDSGTDVTNGLHPADYVSLAYAAPEIHDRMPRNKQSDIFSLGCVLFEILCARAAVVTTDKYWQKYSCAFLDRQFTNYTEYIRRGSVGRMLNAIEETSELRSLHWYVPLVRDMLSVSRDARPDAEVVVRRLRGEG
jgi:serine/threonine protein kinase